MKTLAAAPGGGQALEFRIRGRVQGVGFRPTAWRIARDLGLGGEVLNDGDGVLLRVDDDGERVRAFLDRIKSALPPLAHVEQIERSAYFGTLPAEFRIVDSVPGTSHTQIAPDAVICAACARELLEPSDRRYRYPFINCTCCGPRLTIVRAVPYDRSSTTMARFPCCDACAAEYRDPRDRRFHAEPIACRACGPAAVLVALNGGEVKRTPGFDDVQLAASLIGAGEIVAVKALGGYHLACDAANAETAGRLRRLKRRDAKPFALMARDIAMIRRYCTVTPAEERELAGVQGPIVLMHANGPRQLAVAIAPGLRTLGFMLPTTPLHRLLAEDSKGPLVMTSGNVSQEPPLIDDDEARAKLSAIATYALIHDREIANRLDDSVLRVMAGKPRMLRRARGYAPVPIRLPAGFGNAPEIIAAGGELKATFCLLKDGEAILSQHQGDLENTPTYDAYRLSLALYARMFDHTPTAIVTDHHPEYLSTKWGRAEAKRRGLPVLSVQHHHAHVAACLAESGRPIDAAPVLGIVLDGAGLGDDGTIWGGEFLLSDYFGYRRVASLKPVALPGGAAAMREPWRNLYAQLVAAFDSPAAALQACPPELCTYLRSKPIAALDAMLARRLNSLKTSSCGRLFDAVAAALGLCRDRQGYEGEAAARLETLADRATGACDAAYVMAIAQGPDGRCEIDPAPMWRPLLRDLNRGMPPPVAAMAFHAALTEAIAAVVKRLAEPTADSPRFDTVALTGGCFQNRLLFEGVLARLQESGFDVLGHSEVPANDGGLSLGQAAVAASQLIRAGNPINGREPPCASAFQAASSH